MFRWSDANNSLFGVAELFSQKLGQKSIYIHELTLVLKWSLLELLVNLFDKSINVCLLNDLFTLLLC